MTAIATPPKPQSILGPANGELCLRVVGTRGDSRLVRLSSSKCTIGSGPQCTLRIHARGVDSLSCLVLRGQRGVVVRNWSGRTRLNGHLFFDAPLNVGDRLSCGTVEFEIVAPPDEPAPPAYHRLIAAETSEQLAELLRQRACLEQEQAELLAERNAWTTRLLNEQSFIESRLAEVDAERTNWRSRQQTELEAIVADRNALTGQFNELAAHQEELRGRADALAAQAGELDLRRDELQERERGLQQALEAAHTDQDWRERDRVQAESLLNERERALQDQTEQFARTRQDWLLAQAAEQKELQAAEALLATERENLAAAIAKLAAREREFEEQRESTNELLKTLSAREKELEQNTADRAAMDQLVAELESRRAAFEQDYQRHHAELDSARADIDARTVAVNRRIASLSQRELQLQATETEQQRVSDELSAQAAELERRAATAIDRETEFANLSAAQAEIDELKMRCENERNVLRESQQQVEEQRTELSQRELQLTAGLRELDTRQKELDGQFRQLQTDREQLDATHAAWQASCEQATTTHATDNAFRITELEQLLKSHEAELIRLTSTIAERENLLERQTAETRTLESRLTEMQAEIEDRDASLARLHAAIELLEQSLANVQPAVGAVSPSAEVAEELAEIDRQKQELERRQQDLDHHQRVIDRQRMELEDRLAAEVESRRELELLTEERRHALDSREAELRKERANLEAERARSAARPAEGVTPATTPEDGALAPTAECAAPAEPIISEEPGKDSAELESEDPIFERLRRITQGEVPADIATEQPEVTADTADTVDAGEETRREPESKDDDEVVVSEAFARFKQRAEQSTVEEDEPEEAEEAVPTSSRTKSAAEDEAEESIEDYMARLMQRVRGEATQEEKRPAAKTPPTVTQPEPPAEAPVKYVASAPTEPSEPEGPLEMVARAQAPEKDGLALMRELANQQARSAIDKSTRKQTAHEVVNKWIIVVVSLGMAAGMGYLGMSGNRMALLGMCAGLAVTIYYAGLTVWSARRFFMRHIPKK